MDVPEPSTKVTSEKGGGSSLLSHGENVFHGRLYEMSKEGSGGVGAAAEAVVDIFFFCFVFFFFCFLCDFFFSWLFFFTCLQKKGKKEKGLKKSAFHLYLQIHTQQ